MDGHVVNARNHGGDEGRFVKPEVRHQACAPDVGYEPRRFSQGVPTMSCCELAERFSLFAKYLLALKSITTLTGTGFSVPDPLDLPRH